MTIKSDRWIEYKCFKEGMISPYAYHTNKDKNGNGIISYGISSYGYDARCSNEFILLEDSIFENEIIDPKNINSSAHLKRCANELIIPPHGFVLTSTIEYFKIPENVLVICVGKSTYARCGLIVNVTPLEPGWEGNVTLELHNTTELPIKVYANEGICQFLFFESDEKCITSYKDRNGKYQGQTGITLPKV